MKNEEKPKKYSKNGNGSPNGSLVNNYKTIHPKQSGNLIQINNYLNQMKP